MADEKKTQLSLEDFHPAAIFSTPPGCAPLHKPSRVWIWPILVIAILEFTPWYGNGEISWSMANKIAALSGLFLLALTLFLGPLSKTFPKYCGPWRCHRKFLGIVGVALIVIHVALSIVFFYKLNFYSVLFGNAKWIGLLAAILAFFIFLAMALTSTAAAVKGLGYKNWKRLQMLGYLALALAIVHFVILEIKPSGMFVVRPLGWVVLAMAALALVARALIWLAGIPGRKKFEEHVSHPEGKQDEKA